MPFRVLIPARPQQPATHTQVLGLNISANMKAENVALLVVESRFHGSLSLVLGELDSLETSPT